MPRRKNLESVSNFPSFKKIAVGFVVLAIALLIFIVYFSFAKATVILDLSNQSKTQTLNLTVATNDTNTDLEGEFLNEELEISQNFQVQNFSEEPGVATGEIKIINNSSHNQTLISTTRFLSPEGILFRLEKNVTVPAGSELTALVYADEAGAKFNLEPTRFTIPGLSTELQQQIYGISETTMSGGIKKVGILTEADLNSARQEFENNLTTLIKEKLEPELENQEIRKELLMPEILEQKISNEIGEEVNGFTITAQVAVKVVVTNWEKLLEVAKEKYKSRNVLNETILNWQTDKIEVQIKNIDTTEQTAELEVKLTAEVAGNFDLENFDKKEISGFDKKGIEYYFSQFPGVEQIEVKFWPFWVKSAPALADRIEIQLK